MSFAELIVKFYWKLRVELYAMSIGRKILPTLRHDAHRKYGAKMPIGRENELYLEARAAQLAQPFADQIVRQNRQFPTVLANKLLINAAKNAARSVAIPTRRRLAA
ncbi:MAG TPA: hypothetical protein VHU84_00725 [Lacipirellulaceae bacterium]|jgi:hypothetical protein|nr:hypothetical protein [Lacipirellulaceae bacterium]